MTHQERIDFFREDMARRSVDWFTAAPPFFQMLWAMGVAIPPPLFWRPAGLAIFYGSLGFFIGFLLWAGDILPDSPALQGAILVGLTLVYALGGPWFYRRKARPLNLPSWQEYPATVHSTQSDPGMNPT